MADSLAVCVGDACIDIYLPPVGKRFIGGSALNTAVHMQRAGCPAAFAGVLGDDADGRAALERLAALGIDTSCVQVQPGKTACVRIRVGPGGEREFLHEAGAVRPVLRLDRAALDFIARHRLVHTTWLGGAQAWLAELRQHPGLSISMDYGDRSSRDFIDRTLGQVDLAFFSLDPSRRAEARELAAAAAGRGPRIVVVTIGSQGALACCGGEFLFREAQAAAAVDTLGAGDAYIGTFLAHWTGWAAPGSDLPGADAISSWMELAAHAAARNCCHFGGWENAETG